MGGGDLPAGPAQRAVGNAALSHPYEAPTFMTFPRRRQLAGLRGFRGLAEPAGRALELSACSSTRASHSTSRA